jgi:hypothetical protein
MFALLLVNIASDIDDSMFVNGVVCACAVRPDECSPYCCCDPRCTQTQKDSFSFCLPEHLGDSRIACDSRGYIARKNLQSIYEYTIQGQTCYAIAHNASSGNLIESYKPADFSLGGYSDFITAISLPQEPHPNRSAFANGEVLNWRHANGTDVVVQAIFLPVAFASTSCNLLRPIRYGEYFPMTFCRLLPSGDVKRERFQSLVPVAFEVGFEYFSAPDRDAVPADQWVFIKERANYSGIQFGSSESWMVSFNLEWTSGRIDRFSANYRPVPTPDIPGTFLSVGFEVQPPDGGGVDKLRTGYVIGGPILIVPTSDPLATKSDPSHVLKIGTSTVLFGVSSIYSFAANSADHLNMTADDGQQIQSIWASYSDIIRKSGGPGNNRVPVHRELFIDESATVPRARWTFVYKKFGTWETPVNLLVNVSVDVARPSGWPLQSSPNATLKIETVFTEVDDNGSPVSRMGEKEYTPDWNMIFAFFFMTPDHAIRTLGVATCIALLAIVWVYYVLLFDVD